MKTLGSYLIQDTLYQGDYITVFSAKNAEKSNSSFIIKQLKKSSITQDRVQQLRMEYDLLRRFHDAQIAEPVELIQTSDINALVLVDHGGKSLSKLLKNNGPLLIEGFLAYAVNITRAIGVIHQADLIHKDIKPANILVKSAHQIEVIDLNLASELARETQAYKPLHELEGTLAYMSPEQTGRMSRLIDYRSDFYSLGVTFFQMLSGRLPFEYSEPIDMVYAHMTEVPPKLSSLRPEVPMALDNVIAKLLEKDAEDRYQSSLGLMRDLEYCLAEWQKTNDIKPFPLAEHDISNHFCVSQKLYGRVDAEKTFEHSVTRLRQYQCQFVFVTGESGIGKTAFINAMLKACYPHATFVVQGKFEQYKNDIAFSALSMAMDKVVDKILTFPRAKFERWQARLSGAMGPIGQLAIDFCPRLKLIMGEQAPLPKLPDEQTRNRLLMGLQTLFDVFTRKENPLVIFIDDWQWADQASLTLLEYLVTRPLYRNQGLLLIGAYRDSEVDAKHPLHPILTTLPENDYPYPLQLTALSLQDSQQLLADTLQQPAEAVQDLADMLYRHTQGNPFYINTF